MLIKNDTQLKRVMQQAAKQALSESQQKLSECIKEFINLYYSEYSPEQYIRTYQFMESLTKTEVVVRGNLISCTIYLDKNLNYKHATGAEVLGIINAGYHGMYGDKYKGTPVWSKTIEQIDRTNLFFNTFRQALISYGFDVK